MPTLMVLHLCLQAHLKDDVHNKTWFQCSKMKCFVVFIHAVDDESCLSVPEYSQMVNRHKRIRVSWQDGQGRRFEEWFEGFPAIVLQHEMDHLEGITLLEHSNRLKRSRYIKKQKKRSR